MTTPIPPGGTGFVPPGAYGLETLYDQQNASQAESAAASNAEIQSLLDEYGDTFLNTFMDGFVGSVGQFIEEGVNQFIEDLCGLLTDVTGIDMAALADFLNGLFGAVVNAVNEVAEIVTGNPDADSGDLASWVNSIFGNEKSLAGRVSAIEGKIGLGADFFDDFKRGDNEFSLDSDTINWGQGGAGEHLGIWDQAAQLKRFVTPLEGTRWAICPVLQSEFETEAESEFTVSAVIHPRGVAEAPYTALYARSNSTMTAGICALFSSKTTRIARYTRTGADSYSYTMLTGIGTKFYSNASTVQFKGKGPVLQVVIDNVLVHEFDDTGGHPISEAYRTVGFSLHTETAIGYFPQYSGGLASFAMRSSVNLTPAQSVQTTASQTHVVSIMAQGAANSIVTSGSNLILDPGFEHDEMWAIQGGAPSTAQKRSGTSSRMMPTSTTDAGYINFTVTSTGEVSSVKCSPGDVFYSQVWVKPASTNTGVAEVKLLAKLVDTTGNNADRYVLIDGAPADSTFTLDVWRKLSGNFTIPFVPGEAPDDSVAPGFNECTLYTEITPSTVAGDLYYFDDVVLREITAATSAQTAADVAGGQTATLLTLYDIESPRPLWDGIDGSGESTFPLSQLLAGEPSLNMQASTGTDARWGFIRCAGATTKKTITFAVDRTGTAGTQVTSIILDVYRLEADGSATLIHTSANLVGSTSTVMTWFQYTLPDGQEIVTELGDIFGIQIRMVATTGYYIDLAGISQMSISFALLGIRPSKLGGLRGTSDAPSTINTATMDALYSYDVPYIEMGSVPTTAPRTFTDNFTRSTLGALWVPTSPGPYVTSNAAYFNGTSDGIEAALYAYPLMTDYVRVQIKLAGTVHDTASTRIILCTNTSYSNYVMLSIYKSTVYLMTGSSLVSFGAVKTATGMNNVRGDGFAVEYNPSDNRFRVYKNSSPTPITALTWHDLSNTITHGPGKRWHGFEVSRAAAANSAGVDSYLAYDVTV